jgi:Rrf2 family protein
MFSITKKANYGISAILELAEKYKTQELVQIKTIAEKRGIPKQYLDQIFNQLARTGIIKSYRGNKGGYKLGRDPSEITLFQVMETLEGEFELSKTDRLIGAITGLFEAVEDEARKILSISLAEIILNQQKLSKKAMFYI